MKYIFQFILFICLTFQVNAETFIVNSQSSFNSALSASSLGDSILWEDGVYKDVFLEVEEDGLYISTMNLGQTVFTGASYAELDGDDLTFRGFQFLNGDIGTKNIVDIRGSNILFTEINMREYTCYKYLRVREESQYVTIIYCNFENRLNLDDQNILSILVDENQPGYHKIQYCSFKNFDGTGNDLGIEPIRIGVSTQAEFISRSLVEFCYFTQCDGDGELISSKATQNVYRFNTFDGNSKAELVLRHGSEAIVYGNFFLNGKGGVRIREGQKHYIYNNYFFNLFDRPIFVQNEDSDPLDDINIAFNTIVNSGEIRLGGSGDSPPTNVTFANNIFSNPDDDLFQDATNNETWISNIAFGDLGITLPDGIEIINPILTENDEGFFETTSLSPAIDAAQSGYKSLLLFEGIDAVDVDINFDIMMEPRPEEIELKDLGCSERPHEIPVRPFAIEANTGPHYDSSVLSVEDKKLDITYNVEVFPNPTHNEVNINFSTEKRLDLDISIIDVNGKVLDTFISKADFNGEITLHETLMDFPGGIYFVTISGFINGVKVLNEKTQLVKL